MDDRDNHFCEDLLPWSDKLPAESIRWHEGVFYVLLILFQVAIFAYISTSIQEYSRGSFLMLLMGGYLLLDIYIIFVFYQISHAREAERQVELMEHT